VVDDAVQIPGVDQEESKPMMIKTKDDQNNMPTKPLLEPNEPNNAPRYFEPTHDNDNAPIKPPITSEQA
jgi:hypothetical protein